MSKQSTLSSISGKTLNGIGNIIRFLPTGTVFLFQFLNPLLTNNGHCYTIHKYLTSFLIAICGFSCSFASFTDSYVDKEGVIHYGVATLKGFWPTGPWSDAVDFSGYRIRVGDFVHAFFSLIVFAVVSLLDPNTVGCFYPSFSHTEKVLLMVLPPVIGTIAGAVFLAFPNRRHGIGYPNDSDATHQL